jgi:signal transduction histidine kinase
MIRLFYNKSINQVTRIIVTFTAFITVFITLILFLNTYHEHQVELKKIEEDYLKSQKELIKNETMRAVRYIKYKHETFGKIMSKKQLQQTIVDTIEHMRDIRNGSGYIFIYTFEGINIADPILKQNSGKNLINFKDPNGKLVIKELIDISKKDDGGYVDYVWNKPTTGTLVNKISYAASYKPFSWMVGSGVYLDDIQKVLKHKKTEYRHQIIGYIIQILLFATALFLTSVAVSQYFTHLIEQDIISIKDTLKNVSQNYENINLEQLTFNEFQEVSRHSNVMINELEELNLNLEKKVSERTAKLKQSEQFAQDLVKKQDKFIKNAIHEINTPLSIIITNIDLFKLRNGENRYLSKIEAGSKIIHNIYNDLSYSIKKDRIEYPDIKIDFSEFLRSRVDFFEEIVLGNHLAFELNIENNIEIIFNDIELQRICDNTISNAIKYSYEKHSIIIALFKENNSIILTIENIGDTIENPNHLFKRFYRENESRGGFGLGLSIIKEICDKKDVKIEITSYDHRTKIHYKFS